MSHAHHDHHHHHGPANFDRAFVIGIVLNLGFVGVEGFYGWYAGSLALLADAGHNLSDVAGLVLAWVATLAARMAPDPRHTYGRQRASILAAFANAVVLLLAMGSLLWEAAHRLQTPTATDGMTVIVVAAIGVLVNGATAALFMRGSQNDMNIRGAYLHMAADAVVSLGVAAAATVYLITGWSWLDPVVSMVIALVIVAGTWGLFRQSLHLLFDGVPEHVDLPAVEAWLLAQSGVADVHDLHVWAMSTTDVALTAHLTLPAGYPGDDFLAHLAHELHDRFGIEHSTLQTETVRCAQDCSGPQCGRR